jgi:polysaccharide transporter, PST family
LKAPFWTFISICIKTVFNLIINKLFAVYFGVNGLTLLAHFQNLLGMLTALSGEGLNKGIIKYLSDKSQGAEGKQVFFIAGLCLNLIIFIIACLLGIFFRESLISKFVGAFSFRVWLLLVGIPLLANLLNLFFIAIVQSQQHFRLFAFLNVLNIIFSTLCIYLSIDYHDVTIALIAYGIGQGLALLITLPAVWRKLPQFHKITALTIQEIKGKIILLGDFVAIGASIVLFNRFGVYLLREYNITVFGMNETGLWEAIMRLSEGYTFAFNATFLVIFYPKVSSLIGEPENLRKYLWHTFMLLCPLLIIGLLFIYFLKAELIVLLFDESFLPALFLVGGVVIGDFFKLFNYLLSNILIAQGRSRLFIFLQGVFVGQFFVLVYFLAPHFGLLSLAITWAISYVISAIVLSIILRKTLFYR